MSLRPIHKKNHDIDSVINHNGVTSATENSLLAFNANGLPKDSGVLYTAITDNATAIGLNTTHRGVATGNPHSVTLAEVGGTTDHTALSNVGSNVHSVIDTHLGAANPHTGSAALGANIDITSLTGITGPISVADYLGFDITASSAYTAGRVRWDNTYHTLSVDSDISDVTFQLGHQLVKRIVNRTGDELIKGQVVYIDGEQGDLPTVTLADADTEALSQSTIGVIFANVLDTEEGYILLAGHLLGFDTSTYAPGTTLFLSTTAGALISPPPATPAHGVAVCKVVTQGVGNGSIDVNVDNGFEISELHDVLITSITDGQILEWDNSNLYWKNVTQVHDTSDITTGTFDNARVAASNVTQHEGAITHDNLGSVHQNVTNGSAPTLLGTNITALPFTNTFVNAVAAGATYDSGQEFAQAFGHAGKISGGVLSDAGSGNLDISAGTGFIRSTNSGYGELFACDWVASTGNAIPSDTIRYVCIDYNFGVPQVLISETDNFNHHTMFRLGAVANEGGTLYLINNPQKARDTGADTMTRIYYTEPLRRDERAGGLSLGETGTRHITVSAGTLYDALNHFSILDKDTNGTDTFDSYSSAGLETAGATQWDTLQFDSSGTLTTLDLDKYMNHWFYVGADDTVVHIYGTAQYADPATAQTEGAPATIPLRLQIAGKLIGRLIIQKSAGTATIIESVFTTTFSGAGAAAHSDLSNLSFSTSGHTGFAPIDAPTFTTSVTIPETAGVSDYNKFLVSDTGVIKYRTGAEVLSDIGASASGHNHTHDSLTSVHQDVTNGSSPTLDGTNFTNIGSSAFDSDVASLIAFWNGSIIETIDVTVTSDGATVLANIEKSGGGDLTLSFSDGFTIFDSTPTATVALTPGSDISPQANYIYILQSDKLLTASTVGFPSASIEYAPVATVFVQSATSLQADGAYKVHVWVDHTSNGQGHLAHINKWIRNRHAEWMSGVDQTLTITSNGGSPDNVIFTSTAGSVFQLHEHVFPAFAATPDMYVVNDSITAYDKVTDLNTQLLDSTGSSVSGKYFSLVVWGSVNEVTGDCKLFVNLPSGSYLSSSGVTQDADKYADFSIPADFKGTGFLISELKLRHQVISGGSWTSIEEVDLRGLKPAIQAGSGAAGSTEFADNTFKLFDESDPTKEIVFQASSITTANTRTITMADADVDLGLFSATTSSTFGIVADGGGSVIAAGKKNFVAEMKHSGTISKINIRSMVAGVETNKSISFDIYYNGSKVSASDPVDLVAASDVDHSSFTGWTAGSLDFVEGDKYLIEATGTPDAEYVIVTFYYTITG